MMKTNPLPFHPQAEIIDQILKEVKHSKQIMDYWPDHIVAKAALVSRESGQLAQASLIWKYSRSDAKVGPLTNHAQYDKMVRAAIKTAAMAIRFLETLPPIHSLNNNTKNDTRNRQQAEDPISENPEG